MNLEASKTLEKIEAYQRNWSTYNRFRKVFFRFYFKLFHRLEVIGRENVPKGASLVAANHGGGFDLDNVALSDCGLPDRQIQALIESKWHFINHWWGRWWVGSGIPVPTQGGINYKLIDSYLKKGGEHYPATISIYPEGHSGLFKNRCVIDMFFPGVVRLAVRYQVPIVPVAMIGFREACPILTETFKDHGPNMPVIMLPPLPLKLKIEFGAPFELDDYYGLSLSKEEEYWIANQIVRPRVADIMAKHKRVEQSKVSVKMKKPDLAVKS
ncbi:1-acyl-sn-glycerol-3-phosphate acyltransferase [bacterium]|nr:1-acyl-sn-glycerol-3-phosphate acyltransferase [bacterium]